MLRFRGFSLIDVIVGVSLLLVLFLALFGVLRASLTLSAVTKAGAGAVALANTQMEYLRGISYDSLGTVGGIPAGTVPQYATSTVDGIPYTTHTFIEYYDDSADGTGLLDSNGITTDYKIAVVTVSYSLYGIAKSVELVSDFAPIGIETSTGGGTLALHIVNASGANVGGASVHIVNAATTPTIDLTTTSNISGIVSISGAATSSEYQIYVSRTGYSSAQTYAHTSQNVNPTPGYLTVAKDQTTTATFAIDLLATLTLSTFSPAATTAFSDTFANTANLASQVDTQVASNELTLTSDAFSGSATSIPLSPGSLSGWGILSASIATSSGSTAVVHVDDAAGNPLPDSVLAGNSAGFSSFPVTLTDIATSSYPGLSLSVNFTRVSTSTPVSLSSWSLSHTSGPSHVPNIAFTLTGTKTIGSNSSSTPIYKTIINDTSGTSGQKTETLEWDAYSLSLPSVPLIEACPAAPLQIAPASATSTNIIAGTPSANTLPIMVETTASSSVSYAKVVLTTSDYAATVFTSPCGLAYFNGLAAGTYTATVSAPGHTTTVLSPISVSGQTATSTIILP
ncbi:MAG: carboxypeptidase-like regulatory domain-containing protein [Minisyncoccota bacterium]